MTNYNLEEFKAWLEADPSRKESLDWNNNDFFLYWNQHPGYFESTFIPAVKSNGTQGSYGVESFRQHLQVAKKWMTEVDIREKKQEEINKMLNFIGWKHCGQCQAYRLIVENEETTLRLMGFTGCIDCYWKREIQTLKAQLAEYEQSETTSDLQEALNTKIQRKKAELSQAITSGRKSTAPLRKEIELLEKIQNLETQINTLQVKETGYQQQIQQKDQQITTYQEQIRQLSSQEQNQALTNLQQTIANLRQDLENLDDASKQEKQDLQKQITALEKANLKTKSEAENKLQEQKAKLEKQIKDLIAEKAAIQEKLLKERQEALAKWEQEKQTLQEQIRQLNEQKDTFQKSADYLRSTLKDAEKSLEETKTSLSQTQEQAQKTHQDHQQTQSQKEEELTKKQEAYALIQERNKDLQGKLALSQEEVSKLTQWISKLEAASTQGDAFVTLQKELSQAQQTIQDLEEQLTAKQPQKNYLWLYALLALVALYFLMN